MPPATVALQTENIKTTRRALDLTGTVLDRLTVVSFAGKNKRGARCWTWICSCGNTGIATTSNLRSGQMRSCGCYDRDRKLKHGQTKKDAAHAGAYRSWAHMLQRCTNPKHTAWKNYGGRGIHVCKRWQKFENFLADMGPRPSLAHSIERIRNHGHYSPNNCKWATRAEQSRNRRSNHYLTFNGRTQTIRDWAAELGIHHNTLYGRRERGWSDRAILTAPKHARRPNC